MSLAGKAILVTGGSRGIGLAIASKLAADGARVMISGIEAEELKIACRTLGSQAQWMLWDIAAVEQAQERISEVARRLDGLDGIVNNAGLLTWADHEDMFHITPETWDQTMHVNFRGAFFACQAAAKYMIENGVQGTIVNTCSNTAFRDMDTAYGFSKWGVRGMTRGLALRLIRYGIRVNAVAPGPTSTSMMGCADGEMHAAEHIPMGRYCYPKEIADVAAFLLDDASSAMVGQVLVADGGELLY